MVDGSRKLREAPDHLKGYTIAFDASPEQREKIRGMVAQAKIDTEKDPNWAYKVRGPPWNPVTKYLKKRQTAET